VVFDMKAPLTGISVLHPDSRSLQHRAVTNSNFEPFIAALGVVHVCQPGVYRLPQKVGHRPPSTNTVVDQLRRAVAHHVQRDDGLILERLQKGKRLGRVDDAFAVNGLQHVTILQANLLKD